VKKRAFILSIAFIMLVAVVTERSLHSVRLEKRTLQTKLTELERAKNAENELQQALALQVKSQSDPAWVEMVLIRELGLLPEGQRLVLFKKH
jgi:hypothetical protein